MEIKFQQYIFYQNLTIFSTTYAPILNPCWYENMHSYTTTKKLRKKAFKINGKNKNQKIGIQVIFTLEIKLEK